MRRYRAANAGDDLRILDGTTVIASMSYAEPPDNRGKSYALACPTDTVYVLGDISPGAPTSGAGCDRDGDGVPDAQDSCPDEDATGFDADADGCVDDLEDLDDLIVGLGLPVGVTSSLLRKVDAALRAAAIGNSRVVELCIEAMILEAEALRGRMLTDGECDLLVAFALNALATM